MWRSRRSSRIASIRIWSPSGSSTYRSGCDPLRDALLLPERRRREGERGLPLARARGPVEQERVRISFGERRSEQAFRLLLLDDGVERVAHGATALSSAPRTRRATTSTGSEASTVTIRCGKKPASSR